MRAIHTQYSKLIFFFSMEIVRTSSRDTVTVLDMGDPVRGLGRGHG